MATGYQDLTEKEKQTLRLMVRGHDAKSVARHLGLSVHTINERLRDARRKMGVSSSREAARLLLESEGDAPNFLSDIPIGDASPLSGMGHGDRNLPTRPRLAIIAGGTIMLLAVAASTTVFDVQMGDGPALAAGQAAQPARAAPAAPEVANSALRWLALVDGQQWQASWSETSSAFRQRNTLKVWEDASRGAQVTLGRVVKRSFGSQQHVPAPPHGYQMVQFRTSFENKTDATETLSLVEEGTQWRVVGYIID